MGRKPGDKRFRPPPGKPHLQVASKLRRVQRARLALWGTGGGLGRPTRCACIRYYGGVHNAAAALAFSLAWCAKLRGDIAGTLGVLAFVLGASCGV